jgi:formate-dependent nitrite reductase membrane component NrfD
MESDMEEVVLQTHWGILVALYLFLGGLAAGTLCVSALVSLKAKDRFKKTVRFGAWAGTILLIVGVLCLVAETSMPLKAVMVWQSFVNPTSWMTIGAWLLVAGTVIAGLFALTSTEWLTSRLKFLKKLQSGLAVLVIPVSFGIALYTGILLAVLVSHPLWHTWLLPVLFTVSALDTGVALVLGFASLREPRSKDAKDLDRFKIVLEKSTVVLVVLELLVLAAYLVTVAMAGGVAATSVRLLIAGALSPYFWLLLVVCGLAVPLAVSILSIRGHSFADKAKSSPSPTDEAEGSPSPSSAEKTGDAPSPAPTAKTEGSPAQSERLKVALPLVGVVLCLVGGCTLRFLVLLAGLPVHG